MFQSIVNWFRGALRPESPGVGSFAVVPSDSADLPTPARSLYVTAAGDVRFTGLDGAVDTWTVPANFVLPVAVRKVWATGTTGGAGATGIKGIA